MVPQPSLAAYSLFVLVSTVVIVIPVTTYAFRGRHLFSANKRLVRSAMSSSSSSSSTTMLPLLDAWLHHDNESFHFLEDKEACEIRKALLTWYRAHRRKLPWRGDPPPWDGSTANFSSSTKNKSNKKNKSKQGTLDGFVMKKKSGQEIEKEKCDPVTGYGVSFPVTGYGVWVSEIMLQQTRVEAVIPYWVKWMNAFPTVHELAAATEEQVNSHWAGLGFYRRARLLHKAAKHVVDKLNGELPQTVEGLRKLDGVGRYTASAIASIAYNVTVPVVDGNVCRVLSRLRIIANNVKATALKDKLGWEIAAQIVQAGDGSSPGEVNQAMMELGSTFCSPSGTGTEEGDPLKEYYWSTRLGKEFLQLRNSPSLRAHLETQTKQLSGSSEGKCTICADDGVSEAIDSLLSAMDESIDLVKESHGDFAGKCGHAVFPLPPPKTFKREEVLAVGAISCQIPDTQQDAWLLVRRPEGGLLSGQWEFPSAPVWTSAPATNDKKKQKRKDMSNQVPTIPARRRAQELDSLLLELTTDSDGRQLHDAKAQRVNVGEAPVEHVFSHVRHTMWIEYGRPSVDTLEKMKWVDMKGREVRWMRECDMKEVGVTSGVRKILKSVKQLHNPKKRQRRK